MSLEDKTSPQGIAVTIETEFSQNKYLNNYQSDEGQESSALLMSQYHTKITNYQIS